MYDEEAISLTYQIADIRRPNKRNADYSKTITIPGTANNNKLFMMIFDVSIDRYFNPNRKADCILTVDSSTVMKGYMRLRSIKNTDDKIDYDIEITGRLADLFLAMGDTKVKDLSWTDLDHTYNRSNQIASWVATIGQNYVYPFIDYGYSLNDIDYDVNHFYPALYAKEIWDRIFSFAGFQYTSASGFFTGTYFKSLIVPFNSDAMRLTSTQIENRRFRTSRETTAHTFAMGTNPSFTFTEILFNDDTTSPNQDTGGNYDTSTGIWTCAESGYYSFTSYLSVSGDSTATANNSFWARIHDITNATAQVDVFSSFYSIATQSYQLSLSTPTAVYISAGTQVAVQLATYSAANKNISVNPGSYFYAQVDPTVKDGDTVIMSNAIDPEMRCSDFVNSIIKMHNLYFEYDKDTPNKIHIEPRPDYYNTTIQDWTMKRDMNRELEIIPMGALQARYYKFTYKKDSDYLNDRYFKETGEIYGQHKETVDNDFLKNTETEELIFSPSPLDSSNAQALSVAAVSSNDRYFPRLVALNSSGQRTPRTGNPRILYYGGVMSCKPWTYTSALSGSSGVTNYPYCGNLDDPITPTVDTLFALPKLVYYDPAFNASLTDNNLYNKYWSDEINEITDYNSSIVVGYFKLTPSDISILDFRNVYHFDFQNFRLNKIYDHNPLSDGFTKCEFIKIKNGIPFAPIARGSWVFNGSANPQNSVNAPKQVSRTGTKGGNSSGNNTFISSNIILGNNNTLPNSAQRVLITGDNNRVGENARNVTILNSSGCVVLGDLGEVMILNSSGVTVTTSNTKVENNITTSGASGGTYTPALTNVANLDGSTSYTTFWFRVGTIIFVSGKVDVDPTTNSVSTQLRISLPIASDFSNEEECSGHATPNNTDRSALILADTTNNAALMTWNPNSNTNHVMAFSFSYRVL